MPMFGLPELGLQDLGPNQGDFKMPLDGIDIDRNMVVKSNDLIEGHYRMSVNAQKLAASIISLVDPKPREVDNAEPLPIFDFSMSELAQIMDMDVDNARKRLKSAMKELKNIQIEVRKPDDPGSYILISLFRTCGYLEREHIARFEFDSYLRSYVRYLAGNFTQYQLVQIKKLRSSYSLRLYEIRLFYRLADHFAAS